MHHYPVLGRKVNQFFLLSHSRLWGTPKNILIQCMDQFNSLTRDYVGLCYFLLSANEMQYKFEFNLPSGTILVKLLNSY